MGQTATNLKTGERVEFINGAWTPVKTATNPNTGARMQLIGGQWEPIEQPREQQFVSFPAQGQSGRQSIVSGLRDLAAPELSKQVLPHHKGQAMILDGIGDAVLNTTANVIEDPIREAKKLGKSIVDTSVNIAKSPFNAAGGVSDSLQASYAGLVEGNHEKALELSQRANDKQFDATIGLAEALTFGRAGPAVKAAKPFVKPPVNPTLEAFKRSSVDPSLATASKSEIPAKAAQQISENLIAGGPARKNIAKQVGQAEARKDAIADSLDAGANTSVAGEAIINGVNAYKSLAGRHYRAADRLIDNKAMTKEVSGTLTALSNRIGKFDDPELQAVFETPIAKTIQARLASGEPISINDLRQLRTKVREVSSKPKAFSTQDDAALASVHKALSDDLYKAIEATSGKGAAARLRTADRHYARTIDRVKTALKPFSKLDQTPEGAFAALRQSMQGQTASRGRGNLKQLVELKRALSPDEMDTVRAGLFRDMGRTAQGNEFSASHFANTWKSFGEAQKNVIFGTDAIRKDMDALAEVMERLQRFPKAANASGSGVSVNNALSFAGLGASVANPATFKIVAVSLAGGNATGRLLTNPRYVKMLRTYGQAEHRASQIKDASKRALHLTQGKKRAIAQITAIETAEPTLRGELRIIRETLNESPEFAGQDGMDTQL